MEDQFYFVKQSKFMAIHFLVHGVHHAFPCDAYRLVFPPILGFSIWFPMLTPIVKTVFPFYSNIISAGILSGYVLYDMTHYYMHHSNPAEGTWAKDMKIYHMQHHYKNGLVGFGVTNKFWDRVFDTELTKEKVKKIE
jgi:4-hydroxysphinganine ceramide fatty acyl 2-hydroxylase